MITRTLQAQVEAVVSSLLRYRLTHGHVVERRLENSNTKRVLYQGLTVARPHQCTSLQR